MEPCEMDDERDDLEQVDSDDKSNALMTCPNCGKEMTFAEAPAHTI